MSDESKQSEPGKAKSKALKGLGLLDAAGATIEELTAALNKVYGSDNPVLLGEALKLNLNDSLFNVTVPQSFFEAAQKAALSVQGRRAWLDYLKSVAKPTEATALLILSERILRRLRGG